MLLCALALSAARVSAEELKMTECAPLTQVYGEAFEADEAVPMNELGVEFGYALYEAAIDMPAGEATLEVEHVRDFAAVYVDGAFQGTLAAGRNTLTLQAAPGPRVLRLYVENIGRITYGPEILDNSKGVFGEVLLGEEAVEAWRIVPLEVRDADPEELSFRPVEPCDGPCFRRGRFDCPAQEEVYLDVSGWGMGEVWINGRYLGSYWDEERQQSIRIPRETLTEKDNRIVVFELKHCDAAATMRLSDKPVFQ